MHEADEVTAARFRLVEAVDPFTSELRGWAVRDSWGLHDEATGWLQYLGDQDYSRNTIKSYGRRIAGFLNWCDLAGVDWRDLSHDLVAKWKRALIDSPYRSGWTWRRRSPKTVDLWLVATIEFYKYAASRGHVPADQVAGLLVRKFVRAGAYGNEHGRTVIARAPEARMPGADADGPVEWIESEGQRAALRSLPLNSRDRYLVDLLDSTGVRFGEALGLHRADQHFLRDNTEHRCRTKGPHVHVRRRTGLDNGALAKDRSGRWIPVPVDVVHSWYAYSDERVHVLGADANPLVFVNLWGPEESRGAAVSQDTLRRELFGRKISKALGEPIHPHMLRHTRATIWANGLDGEANRDLMVVQELLGHRSLASTQVYLHSAQTRMRQSVEAAGLRRAGIEETA